MKTDQQAVQQIEDIYESDWESIMEDCIFDSVAPAICMNDDCEFTAEYEPDQNAGHCDECGTKTVKSYLILASVI